MAKRVSWMRAMMVGAAWTATLAAAACKRAQESGGEVDRSWAPAASAQVMGVDAAAIKVALDTALAAKPPAPVTSDAWKHVRRLYSTFSHQLLWLDNKGVHAPRVSALLLALANADSDALRLDAFPLASLAQALDSIDTTHPTAAQLAQADVLLSACFATYGENMLTGQFSPGNLGQAWHINPEEEHVDSALALTLRETDLSDGLRRMRPQDPQYDSLRVAYMQFRALVSRGPWDTVPSGQQLRRGDHAPPARLAALRARLAAEGFLPASPAPADSAAPGVYDAALAGAVADFQARHGIGVDSMLGTETVTALNVPAAYRLAEIATNLERYRWMPRSFGQRYILVNVPRFALAAYDSGRQVLQMKVIVGQEYQDKATPVFADSMEYVEFRPYWNVTPTIAANEIFPKLASDPSYLADHQMETYQEHGQTMVRQLPGPKNALGLVKFMFPNDFNIYLHDTPDDQLFDKDVRAFSHGCIRVQHPAELASWVLGWPLDRVDAAMHDGPDHHDVQLPEKIPVYIVYFTTYVDNGQLYFGNDLYDRDSQLVNQLEDIAVPNAATQQTQQALRKLAGQAS